MAPPRKTVGITDIIIIACVAAFGAFRGELWTAILCGCGMAITLGVWRAVWFLGAMYERQEGRVPDEPR